MKNTLLGALLAALALLCALSPADARRAHHVRHMSDAPVLVPGAMVDGRYPNLRLSEAYDAARAWKRGAGATRGDTIAALAAPCSVISSWRSNVRSNAAACLRR